MTALLIHGALPSKRSPMPITLKKPAQPAIIKAVNPIKTVYADKLFVLSSLINVPLLSVFLCPRDDKTPFVRKCE